MAEMKWINNQWSYDEIQDLIHFLRAQGVRRLVAGSLELELGPVPAPELPDAEPDRHEARALKEKEEERGPDGLTEREARELYASSL